MDTYIYFFFNKKVKDKIRINCVTSQVTLYNFLPFEKVKKNFSNEQKKRIKKLFSF